MIAREDSSSFPYPTIRHESCAVLLSRDDPLLRCIACSEYRKSLRAQLSWQERTADRTDPSSHVNNRYLTSQEKGMQLKKLHDSTRSLARKVSRMQARIKASIERDGIVVDDNMHGDIHTIMSEESATIYSQSIQKDRSNIVSGNSR